MDLSLVYSDEVLRAKEEHLPIVALESTIISHGMPFPKNIQMARDCENIIRNEGAIPATIAIIGGKVHIGLTDQQLLKFAEIENVDKVSRRDIAVTIQRGRDGATTVSATMIFAKLAGIDFFATGGIGGVHKNFEKYMDVSADLEELSETEVNVICSGVKSILDLPKTMEYLETKGIPVIGFKTDYLPQFFTRSSNIRLNTSSDSELEIARIIRTKHNIGLRGAVLIVNPVPKEHSLDERYISKIIDEAIIDAQSNGIVGKDITPFLLASIVHKTDGKSLDSNIALVLNNAKVAAKIAVAYVQSD